MKKYLYSALALIGMLFMNSCSQDDLVPEPNNGDFVNASFTIGTTEGIGTRAVGLAENVDQVTCAVFDANNDEMTELRQDLEVKGGKATYEVRLAKGQNYRVAFFAYDKDANAYDVSNMKSIKVLGNQASNMDNRDAFTAYTDINAADLTNLSNIDREVRLYRPFAQLNLGVDDVELEAARKAGIVVTNTQITVSNVYNAFSAFDNAVAADATPCEMTFAMNGIPQEKLVVEGTNYNYLALNYLLVGDVDTEKSLADVEFVWATADGKTNTPATNFINIPVQRNYRTNIIGKLLTTPTEYNIVVDNHFCGEKVVHKVFNTLDLQAALDAASDGETVLYLADDITGDVVEQQKADRNIVIDGQGFKWNGTIKIHNGSNYNTGTFTVKNVNFETSDNKRNFIEALENGSERYSNNVTIENCTFKSPATRSENDVVGVQVKNSKNLQVLNCTATGIHSLLQAQSCGESVIVKGCTINGKNGVAFKQVKNAVVEGCEITATAYGIRFDGNVDNYGITVKDNNVTAVQPFIVRKMTGQNNTIALQGENTLTTTATPAYQIVITNGNDDAEYVKPTGTYTLTGADNFLVYPRDYYHEVNTWDEFTAALGKEPNIKLMADISYDKSYDLKQNVTIDLNSKILAIDNATAMLNIGDKSNSTKPNVTIKNGNLNCKVYGLSGNVTIKDVVFGGTIAYVSASQGVINTKHANLLMENCKMTNVKKSGSTKPRSLCTEGRSSGYLILRDCNFKNSNLDRPYINPLNGNATLELTNCALYGGASNIDLGKSYSWINMNLTGCSGGFTFTISRASTSLTDEEMAVYKAIKKNNSGSMRFIFTDGEKNNL